MTSDLITTREEITALAAAYAEYDTEIKRLTKLRDTLKDRLKEWMDLEGEDEIIDEETGQGVKYGKPRRSTQWDTHSMPAGLIEELHQLNLLDVRTTAIDKQKGTSSAVDEAQKYRIDGESAAPLMVVTK